MFYEPETILGTENTNTNRARGLSLCEKSQNCRASVSYKLQRFSICCYCGHSRGINSILSLVPHSFSYFCHHFIKQDIFWLKQGVLFKNPFYLHYWLTFYRCLEICFFFKCSFQGKNIKSLINHILCSNSYRWLHMSCKHPAIVKSSFLPFFFVIVVLFYYCSCYWTTIHWYQFCFRE